MHEVDQLVLIQVLDFLGAYLGGIAEELPELRTQSILRAGDAHPAGLAGRRGTTDGIPGLG